MRKTGFTEGLAPYQLHPMGKNIKPAWVPTEEEVRPHITISRPAGW